MLLDRINEFRDKNFAYFCRFGDERISGMERLFISENAPVNVYKNAVSYMNNQFMKVVSENKTIPIFVSYDFVDDIYPDIMLKRSEWPQISYIIPDREYSQPFTRTAESIKTASTVQPDPDLEKDIESVIERIKNGDLLQIVLSRRFNLGDYDPLYILRKFMAGDRSLYVYYYKFGDLEIIGSSPENLVSLHDSRIEIFPVAGTRRRGETEEEDEILENDLKNDEKELLEHRMLVDLARNDLGRICTPGSVRVEKSMDVEKFASVQHLVSRVSGIPENYGFGDILASVFPAGTVSGAPKKKAMTLINQYEKTPRGPYAGALGIAGNNELDLALLIRSLYRNRTENYTQAGAGIVKDSVPVNEVNEMYSKILTVTGGLYEKNIDY
ncbi:MAG: chorismate-binding protein [Ferroplasma sp.]|uniref:chorismate-binding protein n=1 Tax=Ferroplasma sp. TaxID=2591003 RepID=UPI00281506FC|nr:chorismate-binding protein [Ferroplasma sp.]WMT51426.1 MAG: chorismate-binding protein [Ferroplasma sp.]